MSSVVELVYSVPVIKHDKHKPPVPKAQEVFLCQADFPRQNKSCVQTYSTVRPTDSPEQFTEFKTAFMQEIGKMVAEVKPSDMDNWMMGNVDPLRFDSIKSMKRNLHGALWGFSVLQRARQLTNCDEV